MTSHSKEGGGIQAGVTMCDVGGVGRVKCCDVTRGILATAGMQYKNCANRLDWFLFNY